MPIALAFGNAIGSRGFTPELLPGLQMRLVASLGVTLNGSTVSAWADQSGNGNGVTQAAGIEQPTFVASNAAVLGASTIRFATSGAQFFTHLLGAMSPPFTVWAMVCSVNASTTYESLYGNNSGLMTMSNGSGVGNWGCYLGGFVDSGHAIQDGNGHSLGWVCNAVNGAQTFCTDGTITTGTGTSAYAGASGKLGDGGAGSQGAGCDLAEMVVCSGALSNATLQALHLYALNTYGAG